METFDQLRSKSDDDIIDAINRQSPHVAIGVGFLFDELHRRREAESSERMERMTESIRSLTVLIAWLTAFSVLSSVTAIILTIVNR